MKLREKEWTVDVNFGNIQPGAKVWSRSVFYVGAALDTAVAINGFLFGDNISPQPVNLRVNIDTATRILDIAELDRDD